MYVLYMQMAAKFKWDDIAEVLLDHKFYLTALELHTELLEHGKENKTLKDFFSNPGNFVSATPHSLAPPGVSTDLSRTPSVSSLDSLELTRYSDDGNAVHSDERVAVLEFELRKADETIKSLRASLTKASKQAGGGSSAANQEPIKPHERKVVNYLIHDFLLQQSNKMTAITFCEENSDQDFDDWSDVGLNIAKPPGLLQLFRNYCKITIDNKEYIEQLQRKVNTQGSQILALQRENEVYSNKIRNLEKLIQTMDSEWALSGRMRNVASQQQFNPAVQSSLVRHARNRSLDSSTVKQLVSDSVNLSEQKRLDNDRQPSGSPQEGETPQPGDTPQPAAAIDSDGEGSPEGQTTKVSFQLDTPVDEKQFFNDETVGKDSGYLDTGLFKDKQLLRQFRESVLSLIQIEETKLTTEISSLSELEKEDLINLIAKTLPNIVQHLGKHKQELLPLLVWVASYHQDSKTRSDALERMMNIFQKPNRKERDALLCAVVTYAKLNGSEKLLEEMMLHWSQLLEDKSYERRMLAGEVCASLVTHLPVEFRSSFLLSMLDQLLASERVEVVRETAVKSLAVLVMFVDDNRKFNQCWELLQKALNDRSQLVVSSARTCLLPSLSAWAYQMDKLNEVVISYYLNQITVCTKQISKLEGESGATERCVHYLQNLFYVVPWQMVAILLSPDVKSAAKKQTKFKLSLPKAPCPLLDLTALLGGSANAASLIESLQASTDSHSAEVQWLINHYLTSLIKSILMVGFSQPEVIHQFCVLICSICQYLGYNFTNTMIRPLFLKQFEIPALEGQLAVANNRTGLTTVAVPVYICGILVSFSEFQDNIVHFIKDTLVTLSTYYAETHSINAAVQELSSHFSHHHILLELLEELAGHPKMIVREHIPQLVGAVAKCANEKFTHRRIIPFLSKLSRDSHMAVQEGVIPVLGEMMAKSKSREIVSNCGKLFRRFVEDESLAHVHTVKMAVLKTLTQTATKVDAHFREEFLIPHLYNMTELNSSDDNVTRKTDITRALVATYKELVYCYMSAEQVMQYVLPGLQHLIDDVCKLAPDLEEVVQTMIKEQEEKVKNVTPEGTPTTSTPVKKESKSFISPGRLRFKRSKN